MKQATNKPKKGNSRRRSKVHDRREDRIYLDGKVIETLPGTRFKVKIERSKGIEPLIVDCQVKTMFKVKNIKIIKGDSVTVEIDPELDIDPENNSAKGTIIQRG